MTIQVATLFPTPVYTIGVPDAEAINVDLTRIVLAKVNDAVGVRKSNIGGWQSSTDLIAWGGAGARRLADICSAVASQITADPSGSPYPVRWKAEMWANVNTRGSSNQSHWHPGSYLSFVYYADDGYRGSSDRSLGGELVFIDPRMPFLQQRTPDLRFRAPGGRTEDQETWVRPFSGLLIAFPSFLSHSVRPYLGEHRRISVAINLLARNAS